MSSSVEQIKAKVDIVTLISAYMKLDKAGMNWKGKCPFHNEKTPSFFVSPDRNSYYCFGCHAKGDIFTFVENFEGVDFVGALKILAEKAGVTLEKYDGNKEPTAKLHNIMEQATLFYQRNLTGEALEYLHGREVNDETISNFRLGYAPDEWRSLYDFLKEKNITEADMQAVGLIKQKENRYYDTFRGRIMFPIADPSGRVVAFSGRILKSDNDAPKYVNSPETVLFNKSQILFGLDKAKRAIRTKDYSILVEGQMDLVMMHQVGIGNTVASSGTALTPDHLTRLRRLSNRLIMAFDGDSAGFGATDRSARLALSLGMDLKVASFPEGKDPADLAKENVLELKDYLKGSKHIIDFYTDTLISKNLEPRKLGQEVKNHVLGYVSLLPSAIERAHFVKNISLKTGIKEEALWEDLKNSGNIVPEEKVSFSHKIHKIDRERHIAGIIIWQNSKSPPDIDIKETETKLVKFLGKERYEELLEKYENNEELLFEVEKTANVKIDVSDLLSYFEKKFFKNKEIMRLN